MDKLLSFHKHLANVLGGLIVLLVVIIVVEAGGRYIFNRPLPGPIEVSRMILAWILFLSLAYALVQRAHVQVTLIIEKFPSTSRFWMNTLIDVVSLIFFGLIMYSGWVQFLDSYRVDEVMAAPIWIPFWLGKLAVPVGCLLFIFQFAIQIASRPFPKKEQVPAPAKEAF